MVVSRKPKKLSMRQNELVHMCGNFNRLRQKSGSARHTKVAYQDRDTSSASHLDMLSRLELKIQEIHMLKLLHEIDIDFLSTPYDVESAKKLTDIGIDTFKIASADIVDLALNKYMRHCSEGLYIDWDGFLRRRFVIPQPVRKCPSRSHSIALHIKLSNPR